MSGTTGTAPAVYSNRPHAFAPLWAVRGVRRWQIGDQGVRGKVPIEALAAVVGLTQARRRHPATSAMCLQKGRTLTDSITSAG